MNFEEEYNKEIEALFKRFPSVQKAKFTEAYKPGIDRMEEFDALLGHLHRSYKTVHVAGTNGKGSVSSMLASSLMANGCKTGLYTSPHILDFRERMKVDGEMVPKEWVYDFIVKYRSEFERLDLSFFEITTSMAFKWFEEMGVDWAVIEVGLGGRFDSTNIITPELSVITSIGLDHCDILGHTLAKIAREKAGIIKKGVPAVVGEVTPETWTVFLTRAAKMDSQLTIAEHSDPSALGSMDKMLAEMDLQGEYQRKNLRTVLCSLDALGIKVTPEIMDGIVHTAARTGFHGRWEKISDQPDVICDIGHNAHALRNNFAQLSGLLESGEYATLIIIYAVMSDKDLKSIIPLMPEKATYIFTTPSTSRALPARKIMSKYRSYCRRHGMSTARLFVRDSVRDAVDYALEMASGDWNLFGKPLVYIGGSTFAVAEALPCFRKPDEA